MVDEKDPKKEELRVRILKLSLDSFAKDGIKPVTMDRIASSLGISKRTLYEVYEDKEALLEDCVRYRKKMCEEKMTNTYNNCNNVLELLYEFYKMHIEDIKNTNPRFFLDIAKYPKLFEIVRNDSQRRFESSREFFKNGVEQGIFLSDINYDLMYYLSEAISDAFLNTESKLRNCPVEETFHTFFFINVRGICTEKGQHLFDELFMSKK